MLLNQKVKYNIRTYENIEKIINGQGEDDTRICLLNYTFFKEKYKLILIDLHIKQILDIYSKTNQQINLFENME